MVAFVMVFYFPLRIICNHSNALLVWYAVDMLPYSICWFVNISIWWTSTVRKKWWNLFDILSFKRINYIHMGDTFNWMSKNNVWLYIYELLKEIIFHIKVKDKISFNLFRMWRHHIWFGIRTDCLILPLNSGTNEDFHFDPMKIVLFTLNTNDNNDCKYSFVEMK